MQDIWQSEEFSEKMRQIQYNLSDEAKANHLKAVQSKEYRQKQSKAGKERIVTGKQIGRASCRERVSSPV